MALSFFYVYSNTYDVIKWFKGLPFVVILSILIDKITTNNDQQYCPDAKIMHNILFSVHFDNLIAT